MARQGAGLCGAVWVGLVWLLGASHHAIPPHHTSPPPLFLPLVPLAHHHHPPPHAHRSINPYADHMYDGINISPFEVMFVKARQLWAGIIPGSGQAQRPCGAASAAAAAAAAAAAFQDALTPAVRTPPPAPPPPLAYSHTCPPHTPQVKEFLLEAQWATATHAKKYSIWARHKVGPGGWLLGRGRIQSRGWVCHALEQAWLAPAPHWLPLPCACAAVPHAAAKLPVSHLLSHHMLPLRFPPSPRPVSVQPDRQRVHDQEDGAEEHEDTQHEGARAVSGAAARHDRQCCADAVEAVGLLTCALVANACVLACARHVLCLAVPCPSAHPAAPASTLSSTRHTTQTCRCGAPRPFGSTL